MELEDLSLVTLLPKPPRHFEEQFKKAVAIDSKGNVKVRDLSEVLVIAGGSLKADLPLKKPWKLQA
jgi:hypothetical protein